VNPSDDELLPGAVYLIELCSGEQRHWQYLGPCDPENPRWWDIETASEFGEASVLYAWKIVRRLG
jgi:hypothetical protein